MSTKHTPGPWSANYTRFSGWDVGFHITDTKHGSLRPVCEAYDKTGAMDPDEIKANARLIAAAPELLKIAIAALALHPEWDEARAIVAKATGEQQ